MKNKIAIQASDNVEKNKEIIKILENLGGVNKHHLIGNATEYCYYFINDFNEIICYSKNILDINKYKLYTLEEYKKELIHYE